MMTKPHAIIIREAADDDLSGILQLYAQPGMDDGAILPLEAARDIFRQFHRYPSYTLYVAECDGAIVGTYALLIMHNLGHLGAPSAIVEDVVVAPDRQGQGIGQAMMRHAMAEAQGNKCYKLVLSSNAKRERAHAFYEALGFERHGYSFRIDLETGDAE
jgi:ribosomal protein S18 acetylase RimI-like enzyme